MGRYHDPATLSTEGRKLEVNEPVSFPALNAQLQEGEQLVALYQRLDLPFKNAPFIPDLMEFAEFEGQHARGIIQREGFFAVKTPG